LVVFLEIKSVYFNFQGIVILQKKIKRMMLTLNSFQQIPN